MRLQIQGTHCCRLRIQSNIRRIDVQPMMMFLVWYQMNVTEKFRERYKDWRTSAQEERKVFSSEGVNNEKKKLEKLYGDMLEILYGYIEIGNEHNGWHWKRCPGSLSSCGTLTPCSHVDLADSELSYRHADVEMRTSSRQ